MTDETTETAAWASLLRPTAEHGIDILALVDSYPTVQVWSAVVAQLDAALASLGCGPAMSWRPGAGAVLESDPGRPQLRLIITDAAAPAWSGAAMRQQLRSWGAASQVAIVHLLREDRWHLTGLAPEPLRIRSAKPGAPNSRWTWDGPPSDLSLPVPVIETGERWLARLTDLLTIPPDDGVLIPTWLIPSELAGHPSDPPAGWAVPPQPPQTLVEHFWGSVPPSSFELALLLAAVPLDLPVMRAVQAQALPESTAADLAEFLLSPLVQVQPEATAGPLRIPFRLADDVRQELLARADRANIEQLARALAAIAPSTPGASLLATVLGKSTLTLPPGEQDLPWWEGRIAVLTALGGAFRKQAKQEQGLLAQATATGTSAAPEHPEGPPVTPTAPPPLPSAASGTPDDSPRRRRAAVLGNFPLRSPNFTGRQELLQSLHRSLTADRTIAVLPHTLHGMGGVGKSLLAVEYIYRHESEYDVIWWIPAETTTRIQSSLVELGQRLGLSGQEASIGVPAVLDTLRRDDPFDRWLLVFDNAEGPEQVRPFLPRGGSGHVIITSRDARWAQSSKPLEVDVFERPESIQLLRRRNPHLDEDEADRLAEALGDLPLAVEQAAAWHAETGMPADEYLRLLRERLTDVLDQQPPLDYETPVIAAWSVSLDRLEARSPAAAQLLKVCAFFAAEPVPRTVFAAAHSVQIAPALDAALSDPIKFSRAVRDIGRYSLARVDHRNGSLHMHRLVQAALIARMDDDEQQTMRHGAHEILAANNPNAPDEPASFSRYGELYPHLLASDALSCTDRWVRRLVVHEGRYLFRFGDHESSARLCRQAKDAWLAAFGEEDPQLLDVARWLGFVLFATGSYAEASDLNAWTLDVYQRMDNAGRGDVDGELEALRNVAIDRRAQGRFPEALELAQTVYERSLHRYGDNEPETLNAAHNLGVSLRLSGDFHRALRIDEDTYNRKVSLYGLEHPITLITRLGHLIDIRELGDYVGVERLHEQVLDQAEHVLGQLNPNTLLARRLLATAQSKAGHHEEALQTSELVTRQLRSRYGSQHPETMAAESNHAIDLRRTRSLDAARTLGRDLHERYARALGPKHPHTVSAHVNLAITHRLLDEADQALHIDTEAHKLLTERLGPDHPLTLATAVNLSSDLWATGEAEAAFDLSVPTLERLTALFGAEHPTTLACLSNQGLDLRRLGRREEAEELHSRATELFVQRLGSGHPAVRQADDWDRRADCDLDLMPL